MARASCDTVIIGAGPAGLAAAYCLGRRGLSYVVLEGGDVPLSGIRRVDGETELLSPTRLSRLPGMVEADGAPRYLRFDELVPMLESYRQRHGIAVETNALVQRVEHAGDWFAVHCRDGRTWSCQQVINATGMISHPHLPPSFDAGSCTLPWRHSLDVRRADLAGVGELLVIGGGTSAAEVLEAWLDCRRPDGRAFLSLRSRLRSLPHRILGVDVHYLAWLPEHLPADRIHRHRTLSRWLHTDPVLGRDLARAVRRGEVERVPAVAHYAGDECELIDGRRLRPDLVVFATGFRYAAPHLGDLVDRDDDGVPVLRKCESTRAPGLYVIGSRYARTFASAYLRGMARDAAHVAGRIAARAA